MAFWLLIGPASIPRLVDLEVLGRDRSCYSVGKERIRAKKPRAFHLDQALQRHEADLFRSKRRGVRRQLHTDAARFRELSNIFA